MTPWLPLPLETVAAITEAMPERLQAMVTLAATTGLRQAECLGLTVDRSGLQPPSPRPSVRVDSQLLVVNKQPPFLGPPKRQASRRSVPLPQAAVDALADHLAAFSPTVQTLPCRYDGGREWTEDVALVFTSERGQPIRRSHFTEHWRAAVKAADAPVGTHFHDLRHFYASLLSPARRVGEGRAVAARARHRGRDAGHA